MSLVFASTHTHDIVHVPGIYHSAGLHLAVGIYSENICPNISLKYVWTYVLSIIDT